MRRQHSTQRSVVLVKASKISVTESPCSVSPVAPFPLFLHHICWDVYFCYALSRHVSFHSLVFSMTLGLQAGSYHTANGHGPGNHCRQASITKQNKMYLKNNMKDGFSSFFLSKCHSGKTIGRLFDPSYNLWSLSWH